MPGIVIHHSKTVYWPIPKCACTAMKIHIARQLNLPKTPCYPHDAGFEWTEQRFKGYTNIALVRHPIKRLLSLWVNKFAPGHPIGSEYVNGVDREVFKQNVFWPDMRLPEFLDAILSLPLEEADPHWAPQTTQLPPQDQTVVYRLEYVGNLLRSVLPIRNESHIEPQFVPWITERYVKQLQIYYASDFELFGYE